MAYQQLELSWTSPPQILPKPALKIYEPELCAHCENHGRAMCKRCLAKETEERNLPVTQEELDEFFASS